MPGQHSPRKSEETVLKNDVIIVTTQRREQSLLEVPVSVSVISGETLEREGIMSSAELEALVPSLNFPNSGSRSYTRPLIRGIGENDNNGTASNITVYVDDVPLPIFLADLDLIDVERVEVLRGPQGTLFGQNSLAGAINVVTQQPSDEFTASVRLGYGSFEEFDAQGLVSGPISEAMRGKLVLSYNDFGGFIDNTLSGGKIDPSETVGIRAVLSADLSARLTADLTLDHDDLQGSYVDGVPFGEFRKNEPAGGNFSDRVSSGASLRLNYEGENFNLTSISAYREFTNDDLLTIQFPTGDLFGGFDNDQTQFTQELRLSSSFGDNVDWLLGAYYFDESFSQVQSVEQVGLFSLDFNGSGDTETFAVFGDVTIGITPKLDLVGGLRYTSVETVGDVVTGGVISNNNEISTDRISSRAAVLYKISDNITLFGSYSSGFRPGTFSYYSTIPGDATVDKETAESFELGFRGSVFEGTFDFDATLFHVNYDNRQILSTVPGTFGGVFGLTNAGDGSTSQGLELAAGWQVTENLRLTGSLATLDTELNNFIVNDFMVTGFDAVNLVPIGMDVDVDFSGNSFSDAPELRMTLGFDYNQNITSEVDGFVRGRWQFVDDQFSGSDNNPDTAIDSYSIANVSTGVQFGQIEFSLEANNLFDEYYPEALSTDPVTGSLVAIPGVPQSFMARFRYTY